LAQALAAVSDDDLRRYSTGELYNFAAYRGYDLSGRLGELAELAGRGLPVCIIHGTADTTVPFAWGEALHRAIPQSEFHAIEGGGHGILQWPAAAAALRDWVLGIADRQRAVS
jgi:pimeloyl-ACP methyl ester carboxylesterase